MSHTFINLTATPPTMSTLEPPAAQLEPKFTIMDLPPLESTARALRIFSNDEACEWQKNPSLKQHQHHQHQHQHHHDDQHYHDHHDRELHLHHRRERQRHRAKSSTSNLKNKVLPTRPISRGLFKGYNDMRRFNCFSKQCSLNLDAFRNCLYCRHIPYISSPLKDIEYMQKEDAFYASDERVVAHLDENGPWVDSNIKFGNEDEKYDAFNDYLCRWKQQQTISKIRLPPQGLGFIVPRDKAKLQQQQPHPFLESHPSRSISNTLEVTSENTRRTSLEQHPNKIFTTICANHTNNDKEDLRHSNKSYGMIDLLKSPDFQLKQKFIDIRNKLGRKVTKTQRSSSAPVSDSSI